MRAAIGLLAGCLLVQAIALYETRKEMMGTAMALQGQIFVLKHQLEQNTHPVDYR